MTIEQLFFKLIRVAIGTQDKLTQPPTNKEWKQLYDIAKKQSLVGVCFAGVQKLVDSEKEDYCGMSEMLYLTWMGMAAKIQQRNEEINKQCSELTDKFRKDGFDVVVLKGQSNARRYGALAGLRQSGDIDAWVFGSREEIKNYITKNYHVGEVIYNHAHIEVFHDTEVEVHFTPSWLYSPSHNNKLQEWFQSFLFSGSIQAKRPEGPNATCSPTRGFSFDSGQELEGFKSPSVEFDLVYLMLHAYRHLMHEGLGLRQVMDYYFTLRAVSEGFRVSKFQEVTSIMKSFGILKFAGAMMYVMQVVFGIEEKYIICEPDKVRGEQLLQEIIRGGNMGRGDDRTGKSKTRVGYFWEHVSRQWSFTRDYPSEVLWSPVWKTWHFVMRKTGRI